MWGRRKKKNIILSLLLVTSILNIDFTDAKNVKWKPGNENVRRIPIGRTLQNGGYPMNRTFQNESQTPIDRTLPNDRRVPTNRSWQNYRRRPIDRAWQNDRRIPPNRTLQNDRRMPIDRAWQNHRRIPIGRAIPVKRANLQNVSRFPIGRITQYNKKMQSLRTNHTNEITASKKRIKVDRIWEPQKDIKVGNKRISDSNAQRMQKDRRMWAVTPRIARMGDSVTINQNYFPEFKSYEILATLDLLKIGFNLDKPAGWNHFWYSLKLMYRQLSVVAADDDLLLTTKSCFFIATTYINSHHDLRKFMNIRYFYVHNLPYEIGYLVAEIVSKYERMLEIYAIATKYFYENEFTQFAPPVYVLYLYTALLEMATVVGHLCAMLQEVEDKYYFNSEDIPNTAFQDYHLDKSKDVVKGMAVIEDQYEDSISAYEKMLAKIRKAKRKGKKAGRLDFLEKIEDFESYRPTTPKRKPKYRSWPTIYGWSIEYYW